MGQKAILTSLKRIHGLQASKLSYHFELNLLTLIEQMLKRKGVTLINKILHIVKNRLFVSCFIFYNSGKLSNYKKSKTTEINKHQVNNIAIVNLMQQELAILSTNITLSNFKVLNKNINKSFIVFFYSKFKRFEKTLFSRRAKFFLDFLSITSILCTHKITAQTYITFFLIIFRVLPKYTHTNFFFLQKY